VARAAAQEAHDLAADLVPAATVAGRLLARQGDVRRATRILEASWKSRPHPEIAEAYLHVRTGDSAGDRLKRAETLFRMRPLADEGRHAVARAAIDAREFSRAREVLAPILTERPTQKALMLMAEIEEAETGDRGRAREWMARAVYAPRDPVWTADGVVLEDWAPISPVTGRLDTVEWKVPVAEIEGPRIEIAKAEIAALPRIAAGPRAEHELSAPPPPVAGEVPAASSEPQPGQPPRVTLVTKSWKADQPAPPLVEPPRPDDPGVSADGDDSDERRSGAL
jgi:HemY protein